MIADAERAQTRLVAQRGGQEALPASRSHILPVMIRSWWCCTQRQSANRSSWFWSRLRATRSLPPQWRPGSGSGPHSAAAAAGSGAEATAPVSVPGEYSPEVPK